MQKKSFLVSLAALALVVIALGLLAVPGFAKLTSGSEVFSGYETIFHYASRSAYGSKNVIDTIVPNTKAIGIDIAALVFIAFALVSYAFSKKSTVLPVVGGVFSTLASLVFFSNALWFKVSYKSNTIALAWSTYLIASLLLIAGVATLFFGIKALLEEKQTLSSKQGYSYLRNK